MTTHLLDIPDASNRESYLHYCFFPNQYKPLPQFLNLPAETRVSEVAERRFIEEERNQYRPNCCEENSLAGKKCTIGRCCCTVLKILLVVLFIIVIVIAGLACAL